MITSNSSYRETYNRINNSLYSKMLHSHSVSKAEFVYITAALLTQRCAICFLQPIIFSTARTLSPTKPNAATSGPNQSPWMCSPVTILFPKLEIFAQIIWKPHTAPTKTPNQTHLEGGKGRKSYHLLRKTTNQKRKARKHIAFLQLPNRACHEWHDKEQPPTWRRGLRVTPCIPWYSHAIRTC